MTRPLYIFDLDGTLANIEHRLHFVTIRPGARVKLVGTDKRGTVRQVFSDAAGVPVSTLVDWDEMGELGCPIGALKLIPDWDAFHAACVDDMPIPEMIELAGTLHDDTEFGDVRVWSGRSDAVRQQTISWLAEHAGIYISDKLSDPRLKMRPAGDFTPDDQLKESWLHAMDPADRARLRMVFDDRRRVVDMWRRNGVRCLHVAEGEF